MNELIMLLWLADFSHSISGILFGVLILSLTVMVLSTIFYFTLSSDISINLGYTNTKQSEIDELVDQRKLTTKSLKCSIITAIVVGVLVSVIPSKGTIHTIAGIKAAELAIDSISDSALFEKTLDLIESKIDEELKKSEKE